MNRTPTTFLVCEGERRENKRERKRKKAKKREEERRVSRWVLGCTSLQGINFMLGQTDLDLFSLSLSILKGREQEREREGYVDTT